MTVDVVFDQLELGNIKLDDEFVISENAWRKGGALSHGSTMYAALHSRVKVEDLLKGVIIQSANDGCIALAEGIAGNEAYVRAHDERPRPRDRPDQVVLHQCRRSARSEDARDAARTGAWSRATSSSTYPEYYKWFGEREFTWNKIRQQNRNPLLGDRRRRRRHEDRFHQRGRLQPRRLRGAERRSADRRGHRAEERQGPRRRGQEAAGVRLQEFRLPNPVRRGPDRGRSQGLWRRAGPGSGRRQGSRSS